MAHYASLYREILGRLLSRAPTAAPPGSHAEHSLAETVMEEAERLLGGAGTTWVRVRGESWGHCRLLHSLLGELEGFCVAGCKGSVEALALAWPRPGAVLVVEAPRSLEDLLSVYISAVEAGAVGVIFLTACRAAGLVEPCPPVRGLVADDAPPAVVLEGVEAGELAGSVVRLECSPGGASHARLVYAGEWGGDTLLFVAHHDYLPGRRGLLGGVAAALALAAVRGGGFASLGFGEGGSPWGCGWRMWSFSVLSEVLGLLRAEPLAVVAVEPPWSGAWGSLLVAEILGYRHSGGEGAAPPASMERPWLYLGSVPQPLRVKEADTPPPQPREAGGGGSLAVRVLAARASGVASERFAAFTARALYRLYRAVLRGGADLEAAARAEAVLCTHVGSWGPWGLRFGRGCVAPSCRLYSAAGDGGLYAWWRVIALRGATGGEAARLLDFEVANLLDKMYEELF